MQFLPDQRAPFSYFDGAKTVYADPLAIYRQILRRTRGKPNDLPNRVFGVRPDTEDVEKLQDSYEAAEQLVALVRDVFSMQPFIPVTGQGARDEHCWKVWDDYCEYMDEQKKSPETAPTSTPPTASPPAPPSPTSSGSASS